MKRKRKTTEKKWSEIKTIGIFLPFLKSRGTEKQALNLCKGFLDRGFKAILFNVQGYGDLYGFFLESGIKIVDVKPPILKKVKRIPKSRLIKLVHLTKKYKCDCILSRAKRTNQISAITAKINHIPSIVVISNRIKKPDLKIKKSHTKQKIKLIRFLLKNGFSDYFVTVSLESGANLVSTFPSCGIVYFQYKMASV